MRPNSVKALGLASCLAFLLTCVPPAAAQDKGLGLGIIIGDPTGLSLKAWTGQRTAVDAVAAWAFDRNGSLHLHVDYLIHDFRLLRTSSGRLPVYYGIGAWLRYEDSNTGRVGIRFPVGLCYIFEKAPFDIFLELGPMFEVIPKTGLTAAVFAGFRYYF